MRLFALSLIAVFACAQTPRLLLTPQRLKRLERDRERQTERWTNFERRVQTVPDSPERGFELALYAVVADDTQAHQAAIAWAAAHPCERRQAALVVNWLRDVPAETVQRIASADCPQTGSDLQRLRDDLFLDVAKGEEPKSTVLPSLREVPPAPDLYALAEYLEGFRSTQFTDLRKPQLIYFSSLPAAYLLSLRPEELTHPSWQQHTAALALVGVDPNLESSQFLQGWALEERFMLRDGPGLAYELLWANPYLPGIGYQNMDPWLYRPDINGGLLARTDWQAEACWIKIDAGGIKQENCPAGWVTQPMVFGHMNLQPFPTDQECVSVKATNRQHTQMLHSSQPHLTLQYEAEGDQREGQTDDAGLWLVPNDITGTICQERKETTHARRH